MANQIDKNFVTTGNDFQGYKIVKYLGVVKSLPVKYYVSYKEYGKGWDAQSEELIKIAQDTGANAITGFRFEPFGSGNSCETYFVFYGTAVVIEPVTA
jgi:uncharacterized protein YbjQ (UPF0145 family)